MGFEGINAIIEIFSGALRGHGLSSGPAAMTLIGVCGTRFLWVFTVFRLFRSFGWLMAVYPVSWLVTSAALVIYYMAKRKTIYSENPAGH